MSNGKVLVRILAIIFIVEAGIMAAFEFLPPIQTPFLEAFIDATSLALLSTIPMHQFVIKPYAEAKTAELQLEAARLKEAFDESLETLRLHLAEGGFDSEPDPQASRTSEEQRIGGRSA